MAMKKCKECGKDVSSSAKACPSCGKKLKRGFFGNLLLVIGILFAVIIWVAVATSDKSTGTQSSTSTASSESNVSSDDIPATIGVPVKVGDLELKVISAGPKTSVGGEYLSSTPAEGGMYLAVQYSYKNISSKPIGMFSKPSAKLLDPNGVKYDADVGASTYYATQIGSTEKAISDLNPGITVKTGDVFEVSKESWQNKGWKLHIGDDKKLVIPLN